MIAALPHAFGGRGNTARATFWLTVGALVCTLLAIAVFGGWVYRPDGSGVLRLGSSWISALFSFIFFGASLGFQYRNLEKSLGEEKVDPRDAEIAKLKEEVAALKAKVSELQA